MTCSMMKEFGCNVQEAGDSCWVVPCSGYNKVAVAVESCDDDDDQRFVDNIDVSTRSCSPPRFPCQSSAYEIEPDASSATYFLAMAAVTGAYVLSLALHQASAVCSKLQTNNQPTKSSSLFELSSLAPPFHLHQEVALLPVVSSRPLLRCRVTQHFMSQCNWPCAARNANE